MKKRGLESLPTDCGTEFQNFGIQSHGKAPRQLHSCICANMTYHSFYKTIRARALMRIVDTHTAGCVKSFHCKYRFRNTTKLTILLFYLLKSSLHFSSFYHSLLPSYHIKETMVIVWLVEVSFNEKIVDVIASNTWSIG